MAFVVVVLRYITQQMDIYLHRYVQIIDTYWDLLGVARVKCLLTNELGNIMCYCTGIFLIACSTRIRAVCLTVDALSLAAAVPTCR